MARATARTETVRVIKNITLELSEDEARALQALFARIGGDPTLSPRRHTTAIAHVLADFVGSPITAGAALAREGCGIDDRYRRAQVYFRHPGDDEA